MKNACILVLFFLVGCSGPDYQMTCYRAVSHDQRDTALLKLYKSGDAFYGDYVIKYPDQSSDDGKVKGNVLGDTLLGTYHYLSRENVRSVAPLVLLTKGERLKLGTGMAGSYMGFSVYARGSMSFGDSLLQFEPIAEEEFATLAKGKQID